VLGGHRLEVATLRVERSWDAIARQYVKPKSKAGIRTVPIIDRLAMLSPTIEC
jgi:hypothetical protein